MGLVKAGSSSYALTTIPDGPNTDHQLKGGCSGDLLISIFMINLDRENEGWAVAVINVTYDTVAVTCQLSTLPCSQFFRFAPRHAP